jgi:hypothetical protein
VCPPQTQFSLGGWCLVDEHMNNSKTTWQRFYMFLNIVMGCQFPIKEWLPNLGIRRIKPWIRKYESWSSFHITQSTSSMSCLVSLKLFRKNSIRSPLCLSTFPQGNAMITTFSFLNVFPLTNHDSWNPLPSMGHFATLIGQSSSCFGSTKYKLS